MKNRLMMQERGPHWALTPRLPWARTCRLPMCGIGLRVRLWRQPASASGVTWDKLLHLLMTFLLTLRKLFWEPRAMTASRLRQGALTRGRPSPEGGFILAQEDKGPPVTLRPLPWLRTGGVGPPGEWGSGPSPGALDQGADSRQPGWGCSGELPHPACPTPSAP